MGMISGIMQAFQLRMKKSISEAELDELRKGVKHTSALHAVLAIVESAGLRTTAFAEVYDKQLTLTQHAPTVDVLWPSHIKLARHRLAIKAGC